MKPSESVTVTVKVNVLAAEGVPEITPPLVMVVPVGNAPEVTAKEYAGVPPCAVMVSEYAVPVMLPLSAEATGTGVKCEGVKVEAEGAFTP